MVRLICALCLIGIGFFTKISYINMMKEKQQPSLCTTEGELADRIWTALHKGKRDGAVTHKDHDTIHVHCHGSSRGTVLINGQWKEREDLYFLLQDQIDSNTKKIVLHCCFPGVVEPIYMMGITITGDSNVKTTTWNRLYEINGKSVVVHSIN